MEVQFTPEQEARLGQIASVQGVAPARLVQDAALLLIEDDERLRAGVRKGIEQADRGHAQCGWDGPERTRPPGHPT